MAFAHLYVHNCCPNMQCMSHCVLLSAFQEVLKDAYKLDEEEPSYLLVTHGGLIKVLFIYLFETLNCQPAPNCQKGDHRRSPRNTTWTQFVVETNKNEILSISCETMFYSDHLDSM